MQYGKRSHWIGTWRRLALAAVGALMLACGGGGGGGGTAPTISNLSYAPHGAYLGAPASTATVSGTLQFTDPDGDVASWTFTVRDAGGHELQSTNQPISGVAGQTTGMLGATATVSTAALGDYTFTIELVDARGLHSGTLGGSFRVTALPWSTLPGLPLPRTGFATVTLNGLIYVLGGDDPSAGIIPPPPIARVDVYDPVARTWSIGPSMAAPMTAFVARVVGGHIVAVGQTDAFYGVQTQEFDPVAAAWTVRAPPPNGGRRSQGGAVAAGRFYTIGGDGGGFESASVESFDAAANLWRVDAPMSTARALLTAVTVDVAGSPQIFALGGYGSTHVPDAGFFRANEMYDPGRNAWAVRAPMPAPVASTAAVAFDGRIFTFGGTNVNRGINSVNRYDPATDTWTSRAALPAPAIVRAEAVGRKILVFAISEIWVYTPDNDIW
jgi:hypothetical protein